MGKNYTRGNAPLEGILAKLRAKKANSFLKNKNGRILDIGCGSYPYFLSTSNFKEKYGIDPSLNLENVSKDLILSKQSADQKLLYKDNFFDAATMLAVFEHIDNKKLDLVLLEVHRVLNKGGVFVITTPAPWSDKLLHSLARIGLISSEEIHEHKHSLQKDKIEDIIKKAGFNRDNIKSGFFELGLNMWFVAVK